MFKKMFLSVLFLLSSFSLLNAQNFAAGVILGEPTGLQPVEHGHRHGMGVDVDEQEDPLPSSVKWPSLPIQERHVLLGHPGEVVS